MLLQTNSYVVPREKRAEHSRLVRKFRQTLGRLGCDQFDVFEQVGANWSTGETTGRFVQMMRFRDRKHQLAVQAAEKQDPAAQALIAEFCELINFPYQQQQGLFAVGFYQSVLPVAVIRGGGMELPDETATDEPYPDAATPALQGEEFLPHASTPEPVTEETDAEVEQDLGGLRLVEGEALGDDIDIAEVIDVPNNGEDRPPDADLQR